MLSVEDLRYSYGATQVVRGISFSVSRGEALGFLGPNGAGKTTTLSCVCGLRADWRGQMSWDGRPFRPADAAGDRLKLGLVPQEMAIYENLSARENLDFFARLSGVAAGERAAAVDAGLELAGLRDRSGDRVATFSGGMKRRLNLAIGTVHSPQLLLLDEPTAGVDPQSRAHLFDSLTRLREQGLTLVYTTHVMEEVERLCSRVIIMDRGRAVADGAPSALAEEVGQPGASLETVFLKLTGRTLRDANDAAADVTDPADESPPATGEIA